MASCAFLIVVYRHDNRARVEGIDVVVRGINDHKKCLSGALIP